MSEEEKQEIQVENGKQEDKIEWIKARQSVYLSKLPKVFYIVVDKRKIPITFGNYIDCNKYESRSGFTYNMCIRKNYDIIKSTQGIYYTPVDPILKVEGRKKMFRDWSEEKIYIMGLMETNPLLKGHDSLLIYFDNYQILFYDKFVKARTYEFDEVFTHGSLHIFRIPELEYTYIEETNKLEILNHTIAFSENVKVKRANNNIYYVEIPEGVRDVTFTSPDHGEAKWLAGHGQYLFVHPMAKD